MTLPASGLISLSQIRTEFSLPANALFPGAFYGKGGAPAAGTLKFSDFYGRSASAATVSAITPATQSLGNTTAGQTFSPSTLTVTGAASVTYTWSFVGSSGGTWAVNAGQGTSGGVARVTGVADATTAFATFRCTVVADGVTYTRDTSLEYSRDSGGVVGATMTL